MTIDLCQLEKIDEQGTTLRSLINEEALINGEVGIIIPAGRLEKIFYYIKNRVQGGIFF